MATRRFVIGDVHGCAKTLRRLVDEQLQPVPQDNVCLLGDLIDRGPDSKGVLDFIFELGERGVAVRSVRGNHEEMFLLACDDPYNLGMWISNGGLDTLESFQADGPGDIPHRYRAYLGSLPHYLLLDNFVIVHAGLNFDPPDPFSDTSAMLWTRSTYVDQLRIGGRRLICGHTPVSRNELEASLDSSKILLDSGCIYTDRSGMGCLAALELGSMTVHYQENIDL